MSDSSIDTDCVSLSDSIASHTPVEDDKRKEEVIDMSRWRDKSLTKQLIRRGKGWSSPRNGDEVSVHYVCKREDGTVIESTRDTSQVFTFIVGRKQVIKGLDIAIKTMKWSEISRFTFSGEYSSGENECRLCVAPGERVVYEVELFYFKLIDLTKKKDGALTKRIIEPGVGYDLPIFGAEVTVDIVGKYEDKTFDERTVTFTVGEAAEKDVIDGIDIAVTKMRKQEKCRLFVEPEYAFGPKGKPEIGIPSDYQQLVYEIRLNEFTEEKEPFELFDTQKLEKSEAIKEKANNFFNQSKYRLAVNQYKRMIKILRHDSTKDDIGFKFRADTEISVEEFAKRRDRLLYIAYQNLSNTYEKLENFESSLKWIENALKLEPTNAKGLYRRGKVFFSLQDYEKAREDFQKSLEFGPNNKSAHNYILECNNAIKTRIENEKKMYSKYFESHSIDGQLTEVQENIESIELKESGDDQPLDQTCASDKPIGEYKSSTSGDSS